MLAIQPSGPQPGGEGHEAVGRRLMNNDQHEIRLETLITDPFADQFLPVPPMGKNQAVPPVN